MAYWGAEVWLHAFLTSALDVAEWSASRPGHFTPRESAPQYPLDRRLAKVFWLQKSRGPWPLRRPTN